MILFSSVPFHHSQTLIWYVVAIAQCGSSNHHTSFLFFPTKNKCILYLCSMYRIMIIFFYLIQYIMILPGICRGDSQSFFYLSFQLDNIGKHTFFLIPVHICWLSAIENHSSCCILSCNDHSILFLDLICWNTSWSRYHFPKTNNVIQQILS